MKIVNVGNSYMIYDDNLKTYDKLPNKVYSLKFSQMSGFYLEEKLEIEINEEKIYGLHEKKAEKVFKSFNNFDKHLGVILSGDKGMGKSLFAKVLSKKFVSNNFPVIIVDQNISGTASYLNDIDQEVVIVFDEFEKIFKKTDKGDPQVELLSLFDGFTNGKKCFIITCNEIRGLNDYLVNRTGRFHYHFRFEYPSPDEIQEYLFDKLDEYDKEEVDKIVRFSTKAKLNYDSLRAITFELNTGETFEACIEDLNILKLESAQLSFKLYLNDGELLASDRKIDLFAKEITLYYELADGNDINVTFDPKDIIADYKTSISTVEKMEFNLRCYGEDGREDPSEEYIEKKRPMRLEMEREKQNNMRFAF